MNRLRKMRQMEVNYSNKIIFDGGSAHFHLDGLVSRHDWRIWSSKEPRVVVERQTHLQRITA